MKSGPEFGDEHGRFVFLVHAVIAYGLLMDNR